MRLVLLELLVGIPCNSVYGMVRLELIIYITQ